MDPAEQRHAAWLAENRRQNAEDRIDADTLKRERQKRTNVLRDGQLIHERAAAGSGPEPELRPLIERLL